MKSKKSERALELVMKIEISPFVKKTFVAGEEQTLGSQKRKS
jgi:hypothetical protein